MGTIVIKGQIYWNGESQPNNFSSVTEYEATTTPSALARTTEALDTKGNIISSGFPFFTVASTKSPASAAYCVSPSKLGINDTAWYIYTPTPLW